MAISSGFIYCIFELIQGKKLQFPRLDDTVIAEVHSRFLYKNVILSQYWQSGIQDNWEFWVIPTSCHLRHKSKNDNSRAWKSMNSISIEILFRACSNHQVLVLLIMWVLFNRWVSVVEFHDGALVIGKVSGQESTVVKWNYQILGHHPVTLRQKLGVILVSGLKIEVSKKCF